MAAWPPRPGCRQRRAEIASWRRPRRHGDAGAVVAVAGPAAAQLGLTRNPRQNANAPIVLRADEIEHNAILG